VKKTELKFQWLAGDMAGNQAPKNRAVNHPRVSISPLQELIGDCEVGDVSLTVGTRPKQV